MEIGCHIGSRNGMPPRALGIYLADGVARLAHFLPLYSHPLAKFALTIHDSGPNEAKAGSRWLSGAESPSH